MRSSCIPRRAWPGYRAEAVCNVHLVFNLLGTLNNIQEEQLGPQTVAPLPGAPPVELPAIPTEFPPLPDVKLPNIEQARSCHSAALS